MDIIRFPGGQGAPGANYWIDQANLVSFSIPDYMKNSSEAEKQAWLQAQYAKQQALLRNSGLAEGAYTGGMGFTTVQAEPEWQVADNAQTQNEKNLILNAQAAKDADQATWENKIKYAPQLSQGLSNVEVNAQKQLTDQQNAAALALQQAQFKQANQNKYGEDTTPAYMRQMGAANEMGNLVNIAHSQKIAPQLENISLAVSKLGLSTAQKNSLPVSEVLGVDNYNSYVNSQPENSQPLLQMMGKMNYGQMQQLIPTLTGYTPTPTQEAAINQSEALTKGQDILNQTANAAINPTPVANKTALSAWNTILQNAKSDSGDSSIDMVKFNQIFPTIAAQLKIGKNQLPQLQGLVTQQVNEYNYAIKEGKKENAVRAVANILNALNPGASIIFGGVNPK